MSCYCYYVGGLDSTKSTIVNRHKIKFVFFGPFFIGWSDKL